MQNIKMKNKNWSKEIEIKFIIVKKTLGIYNRNIY